MSLHPSEKQPLVTIITPAYNQAEFLEETIDSVLAQRYPHIEYIVIDDGSTDTTPEVLGRYKNRVRIISQSNLGQSLTLNQGWSLANGEIVGYLSSDDILHPWSVEETVNALLSSPEAVVAFPDCDLIDPNSRTIRSSICREFDYEALVRDQECYIGVGALFKRDLLERVGGWRPDLVLAPDREFWMRAGLIGSFIMAPRVCALYRMHPKSLSYFKIDEYSATEYVRVMDAYFRRDDVPDTLLRQKCVCYGNAHLVSARIHLRGGRMKRCVEEIKTAYSYNNKIRLGPALLMMLRTSVSRSMHRMIWNARKLASKKNGGSQS
ncbi:glycosyltransferase family 2 protein [Saccharibacillus sp. CPCC 101409]|uniref:glycosyltransferase family 2 protein n=1 Tax=Saccharibacillus sp. CPCC 101409 TaxID=3058041 RepID=UPI0026737D5B|nr:glycosyltransferase family 2 protein [Saccharibacillus sp. CPCC 101409]MDO3412015.1 glycosyltransferase family 2 protein [Saccharibacillus sp. CPCC 101409]